MKELILVDCFDAHYHFRQGAMLQKVLRPILDCCIGGVAMPNRKPRPVLNAEGVREYRKEIVGEANRLGVFDFEPAMTMQITEETTPKIVREVKKAGAKAGKVYPEGATYSEYGVRSFTGLRTVWHAMERLGMPLLIHAELAYKNGRQEVPMSKREEAALPTVKWLRTQYPTLPIVVEHVSTAVMARYIEQTPGVWGSVSPIHLSLIENDALRSPYHLCAPVPKTYEDQEVILEVITGRYRESFFYGSDCAAHEPAHKECARPNPGVYCPPEVGLPILAERFEKGNALDMLQGFIDRGREFYGVERRGKMLRLRKQKWIIPAKMKGLVPLWAGRELSWRVVKEVQ